MCEECTKKILSAYEFRQNAIKAEETLKHQIQNEEIKTENTVDIVDMDHMEILRSEITTTINVEPIIKEESSDSDADDPLNGTEFHDNNSEDDQSISQIKVECILNDINKVSENVKKEKVKKPHLQTTERLTCDICGKTFCNKTSIRSHMIKIHKNSEQKDKKPAKSPKIPKSKTTDKHDLIEPQMNESEQSEIKIENNSNSPKPEIPQPIKLECGFGCPICSKQFTKKRYVEEHIRGVHLKIPRKPYNKTKRKYIYNRLCSICGQSFDNISSYRSHYKRHFPEQCLSCRYCGKLFTGNSILKIHELIHTGEKPFKCDVCDFRCNAKNWLKVRKFLLNLEYKIFFDGEFLILWVF